MAVDQGTEGQAILPAENVTGRNLVSDIDLRSLV